MSHLKSIDSLQIIFMQDNQPYWRLYNGQSAKGGKIGENMEEGDLEGSFELLSRRIESYGTGSFCIYTMKNANTANARCNVHLLRLGSVAVSGTESSPSMNNFQQMITVMDYLNRRSNEDIAGVVEAMRDDAKKDLKIFKMKMEMQQMKNGSRFDRVFDKIAPHVPALLGVQPVQAGELGSIGFTEENSTPSQEQSVSGNASNVDLNKMLNLVVRLGKVFPGYDPVSIFEQIVLFAEQDPEKAIEIIMENQ
ncbi:MAG: hypothetical protein AAF789_12305 [Bacteroidota bacterium]